MLGAVLEDLLTHALDAVWMVDEDGTVRYMNPAAEALCGFDRSELEGQPLARILPPEVAAVHDQHMRHFAKQGPRFDVMGKVRDFSIVDADGKLIPVGLRAFEVPPQDGRRCFGAIMRDQRQQKRLEGERDRLLHRLAQQALTDELTDLPNRRAFVEELERVLAASRRSGGPASLAILDIDHFKRVNDTFGHPGGDWTLRAVAKLCRAALRGEDYMARIGGEEFAIVFRGTDLAAAQTVAERVRQKVEQTTIQLPAGGEVEVTLSIGLAAFEIDSDPDGWLAAADTALYAAKRGGRNRVATAERAAEVARTA